MIFSIRLLRLADPLLLEMAAEKGNQPISTYLGRSDKGSIKDLRTENPSSTHNVVKKSREFWYVTVCDPTIIDSGGTPPNYIDLLMTLSDEGFKEGVEVVVSTGFDHLFC